MNEEAPPTEAKPVQMNWRDWVAVAWIAGTVLMFLRQVLAAHNVF